MAEVERKVLLGPQKKAVDEHVIFLFFLSILFDYFDHIFSSLKCYVAGSFVTRYFFSSYLVARRLVARTIRR